MREKKDKESMKKKNEAYKRLLKHVNDVIIGKKFV
jgi:hypothetical protein